MLAKRIIPVILTRGRTLVKGLAFDSWRSVGVTEQAVKIHSMRGVDEIILLDIAASKENRGPDLKLVEKLTKDCFMPLTVGGGIRTLEQAKDVLLAGADKVSVKSGGLKTIRKIADSLGSQAVVASIDTHSGNYAVVDYAKKVEASGAGEILLTTMELEGAMTGYDIEIVRRVSGSVGIPVIANGGCGKYSHMLDAIRSGADGVAAGSMFLFTDQTPAGAAEFLNTFGIEVRLC